MSGGIIIPIAIFLIVGGAITVIVASYFKLQRHRADAAALAEYRKLAERVVAGQEAMRGRLDDLDDRLKAIEKLLHSVG
ncbi:hypothetical protein [Streptomyces sp. MST-110588]|uniref:hypothetical protein n=1 Tax=Streptomyces sp. MST-110588 TaxID=2833628 RepID=UPI001F5DDDF0|nr:hypothetical protein [Streptomyces sp. MST-110588]UNO40814.1 hypothetical protein KGS77_16035 [Streptomyces sp. MST-110588]